MSTQKPVIIIKRIKKGGHGGHHGGAWKVAYADFVTAMMAFFLLMWLLNATTQEQRRGISNYFGPAGDAMGSGGSGGVLGGNSLEKDGNFEDTKASAPIETRNIQKDTEKENEENDKDEAGAAKGAGKAEKIDVNKAQKMVQEYEAKKFQETEQKLRQAIQDIPDIKDLAKNLIVDQTPEGLRIQIVDQKQMSMFPNGSAEMYPLTYKLIQYVEKIVEKLPNKISITGHTDSKPYSENAKYSNWELSSDRANATRRTFLESGLNPNRILYVAGRADTEPLHNAQLNSDQNRRISIVLHRTDSSTVSSPSKK